MRNKVYFPIIVAAFLTVIVGGIVYFIFDMIKDDDTETVDFYENEAIRVMDTPVTMAEFMLYTIDIKAEYDESEGEEYYSETGTDAEGNEETNENIVKEEIAESIRMVKVLCKAAEEKYDIFLSDDEETLIKDNAATYYEELIDNGVDSDFLSEGVVKKFIKENYLAQKVYSYLESKYGSVDETEVEETNIDVGNDMEKEDSTEEETQETATEEEIAQETIEPEPETEEVTVSDTQADNTEDASSVIADLLAEYDPDFTYKTHINWELMDAFSFVTQVSDEELYDAVDTLLENDTEDETQD